MNSVLIKGVKMPKNCIDCPCHNRESGYCQADKEERYVYDERPHWCPLVELTDLISRRAAIDALWKALYEYEDKTEKQFQESEDLDVGDWMVHRIFVQNMNGIDIQTILALPSAPTVIEAEKQIPRRVGSM